jgi:hypothetical protein
MLSALACARTLRCFPPDRSHPKTRRGRVAACTCETLARGDVGGLRPIPVTGVCLLRPPPFGSAGLVGRFRPLTCLIPGCGLFPSLFFLGLNVLHIRSPDGPQLKHGPKQGPFRVVRDGSLHHPPPWAVRFFHDAATGGPHTPRETLLSVSSCTCDAHVHDHDDDLPFPAECQGHLQLQQSGVSQAFHQQVDLTYGAQLVLHLPSQEAGGRVNRAWMQRRAQREAFDRLP